MVVRGKFVEIQSRMVCVYNKCYWLWNLSAKVDHVTNAIRMWMSKRSTLICLTYVGGIWDSVPFEYFTCCDPFWLVFWKFFTYLSVHIFLQCIGMYIVFLVTSETCDWNISLRYSRTFSGSFAVFPSSYSSFSLSFRLLQSIVQFNSLSIKVCIRCGRAFFLFIFYSWLSTAKLMLPIWQVRQLRRKMDIRFKGFHHPFFLLLLSTRRRRISFLDFVFRMNSILFTLWKMFSSKRRKYIFKHFSK